MPGCLRRPLLRLAAATFTLHSAAAQDASWPVRPIRLVLPYTPGGGTDAVARTLAARLHTVLGQPVAVKNRPGAGGNVATEIVAQARPDGYTLLMGNQGPMTVNPTLFRATLKVDPAMALEPVAMVADTPLVLVVSGDMQNPVLPHFWCSSRLPGGRNPLKRLSFRTA